MTEKDEEGTTPDETQPDTDAEEQEDPGPPQFVTTLSPIEQQVGVHVIAALQHEDTVAVITTVAMGRDGQQRIISVGLDPELLEQVQELIMQAQAEKTQRVPCVGFHCRLEDREDHDDEEESAS